MQHPLRVYSVDVRRIAIVLSCVGLLVSAMAGCGSSGPDAPFKLACSTHKLPSGLFRVAVTVTNTTNAVGTPIIYGPTFERVRKVSPALAPTYVVIAVAQSKRTYIGFVAPPIMSGKSAQLFLRFQPPLQGQSILVTRTPAFRATDWSVLDNPDCRV